MLVLLLGDTSIACSAWHVCHPHRACVSQWVSKWVNERVSEWVKYLFFFAVRSRSQCRLSDSEVELLEIVGGVLRDLLYSSGPILFFCFTSLVFSPNVCNSFLWKQLSRFAVFQMLRKCTAEGFGVLIDGCFLSFKGLRCFSGTCGCILLWHTVLLTDKGQAQRQPAGDGCGTLRAHWLRFPFRYFSRTRYEVGDTLFVDVIFYHHSWGSKWSTTCVQLVMCSMEANVWP